MEFALLIHERQIAEHGGGLGIRDVGLLEGALGRPQMLHAYGQPDLFDLAACYGWGLAKNHPFVDGNKRTAFVLCLAFLRAHGFKLTASQDVRYAMFYGVAAGTVSESELANWLRDNSVRA
ncbi:type II toxin-antitoxin system death-on-curing family toxin [Aerophototrophica crusticola]|uniref:type II toxin-antitoxin system death-on-curing family toxin n=1 Tax=Aerophototrophica crusticola TaxID=1709002 RepID=UPI00384D6744